MDPIFQPVTGGNKSEAIVLQIEAAIVGGNYQTGDRLPSERHLQNLFNTSRGAVREALHALRQKGLLETRKGSKGGYYIKEVDINEAIDHLALMITKQSVPLGKLLEFQYAMDKAVLFSAVNNAVESEIDRMAELAQQLNVLCNEENPDFEQIASIDNQLNLMLVEMSGNPFYAWIMRSVQLSFRDYEFIVYKGTATRKQIGLNWQNTAKALRTKDVQKALRLYGHWYVILEQCLEKHHGKDILTRGSETQLSPFPPEASIKEDIIDEQA